jgi:hypothetical protein
MIEVSNGSSIEYARRCAEHKSGARRVFMRLKRNSQSFRDGEEAKNGLTVTRLIANGETVPSFGAACREDFTSVFGRHACAETVYTAAAQLAGLIRAFHCAL